VPRCDCAGTLLISDSESFLQQKVDRSLGVGISSVFAEATRLSVLYGALTVYEQLLLRAQVQRDRTLGPAC
jgi:hypothetical protein